MNPIAIPIRAGVAGLVLMSLNGSVFGALPAGLASPHPGVVCNAEAAVCWDRFGPGVALTHRFLGVDAARSLEDGVARLGSAAAAGQGFPLGAGVRCDAGARQCSVFEQPQPELTELLYGAKPKRPGE